MSDGELQWGGCQCGRIRYKAPTRPLALYVCHCTECRKQSASAFGISFAIARGDLSKLPGVIVPPGSVTFDREPS